MVKSTRRDQDGTDDEQVVADHLQQAQGRGDLRAAVRAEQHRGDDAGRGTQGQPMQEEPARTAEG